jgi:hypothetical protein
VPFYDRKGTACEHVMIDCYEPISSPPVACKECGGPTERAWLSKPATVIQDSIEGGVFIRHGLCNPDGSPRKYYSKSEIAREAAARGLVNLVQHVPERGSDRSPHTSRWI